MAIFGFSGHRDLPDEARAFIQEQLTLLLAPVGPEATGICSLASGADQLFASTLLALGGSLGVVVPSDDYEQTFDAEDRARYRALLARASRVETLPFPSSSDEAFSAAGRRVVDVSDAMIAAWDGEHARGPGGTGDVVAYARQVGRPVTVLWPRGVRRT